MLVMELLKLSDKTRADYLFLENVQAILGKECRKLFFTLIFELLKRGFRIRWVVVRSHNIGCPMTRARFFGLAIRNEIASDQPSNIRQRSCVRSLFNNLLDNINQHQTTEWHH